MLSQHQVQFSAWGFFAVSLVVGGALLARGGAAQDQPLYVSGSDVARAHVVGDAGNTVRRMESAVEALKANDWDIHRVPFELLQTPDQQFAENAHERSDRTTAFCVPREPVYSEVALYCDTYFRKNISVYKDKSVAQPEGFWLVAFKDGTIEKVRGEDVRMYPHPTIPDAMMPIFPGMSAYREDLPKLSCYE